MSSALSDSKIRPQANVKPVYFLGFFFANLLAFSYVFNIANKPFELSYLLKASPVLIYALLAIASGRLTGKNLGAFVVAMLASSVGDVFLDFDRKLYLLPALGSFLVAQVAYIYLFWPKRSWQINPLSKLVIALVITAELVLIPLFYLNAERLFIPVLIYMLVLSWMALAALLYRYTPFINLGGILFLIADGLIGINQFVFAFNYAEYIIVSIYSCAQALLAWGVIFHRHKRPTQDFEKE